MNEHSHAGHSHEGHDHSEELRMLNIQAQMIAEQVEKVDAGLLEMEYIKNSLDDLKATPKGKEILSPISNGIFVKTTLQQNDTLLVNVGNEVVIEKSVDDTKTMLDSRIQEMASVREQLLNQLQKIESELIAIGEH